MPLKHPVSLKRKKHQRAFNALMRRVNKVIENDELWRGRYVVRQIQSTFRTYEDKSGADLFLHIRFYDKKTGETWDRWESSFHYLFFNGNHLFYEMNEFITQHTSTWTDLEIGEVLDPYKDTIDYRKLPIWSKTVNK